jgi:hemolysin activation/secretion protein
VQVPVVGNFALVPRHEYGFADWDFILRAFFDTASTKVVNPIGDGASRFSTENGQLMQSAGVGAELRLKQNINIRFDWGIALRGVDLGVESADAGDSEFHISATILY